MPQVGPTPLREPGRRTCSLTSSDIDYPNPEMTLKGRNWKALHKRSTLAVDKLWMGIAHAPFPAWNSRGEPSIDTKTFFFCFVFSLESFSFRKWFRLLGAGDKYPGSSAPGTGYLGWVALSLDQIVSLPCFFLGGVVD